MKFKGTHFRGRIETWIWKQIVEHGIQSLGYKINKGLCSDFIPYENEERVPVYLAPSEYIPDCFVKIGHRSNHQLNPTPGVTSPFFLGVMGGLCIFRCVS